MLSFPGVWRLNVDNSEGNFIFTRCVSPEELPSPETCGKLHYAIFKGDRAAVEYELMKGADINKVYRGMTPLHHAISVEEFDAEMIELLLKFGPNMNAQNNQMLTPLHELIRTDVTKISLVEKFLEMGADPNIPDSLQFTISHTLSLSISRGDDSLCRRYIELMEKYSVNINTQNFYGDTPLHEAVRFSPKFVNYLLDNGADIYKKNNSNKTAMDEAYDQKDHNAECFEIMGKQALMLDFCQIPMTPYHSTAIMELPAMQIFKENCDQEISTLKAVQVDGSNITLHKILYSSTNRLAKYMKNETILEWLQNLDTKSYNIFGKRLQHKIKTSLVQIRSAAQGQS